MTRLLVVVLALVAGLGVAAAPAAADDRVTLDGVRVGLRPHTRQVVTARHTAGHRARVTLWTLSDDRWVQRLRAVDGRTGYGGLVRAELRRQGSGTTPLGTFRLLSVFGTVARRDTGALPYRRIRPGDYWVQDNASRFYNRLRNRDQGGFRWWLPPGDENSSERLADYPRQYRLAVVTGFNRDQVRHRGSGIFLHVNGRGATAGCVSAPRGFLERLVRRLRADRAPMIAIGR
jgi:L,D-peptidoglycan transpeptidase YkuD (ErfK/YbiS/YcfS/YnhG family)